ncbi:ORF6N domain-containing protein [Salmonella enterica subsp. enterica]|nr:ORF6N domain-containing protein [Salmonella enterica subsp. enterica serovar Kambole]ECG3342116.1 ORF6N domain-containing protein [Salmonella enterica subsp. enterica serovar Kambole]ECO3183975.1 ORF6N domain-containing protein [Salmonella enterica subsp. enterica serovar Kambole]ECY5576749.1 ORF6N domain-containing protein [Salmonella enterica subsp. enterica serovar Kambole]EDN3629707.1 ORF6N domain-containing protein [Salmonella enterica subsp. enterica serovar Kambole]
MKNEIQINNTSFPVVEYAGQRVVTFAMIDRVHGRPEGTAKRNFTEHKPRFVEDEDFYVIDFTKKNEFRTFEIGVPPRGLTVLTETGYLMLVKSFTDDLSWKVQRELVNNYFRKTSESTSQFPVPQTKVEALALALELAKENEKLAEERDEAIRTKAQISQTREATACQRNAVYQRLANNAIKEREEMAALLGASKEWASTRAVWRATGMWYGYRRLMNWCDDHNMPDTYCFDPKSDDRMLCYPRRAWVEVYGVDIAKLF